MFYLKVEDINRSSRVIAHRLRHRLIEDERIRIVALCDDLYSFYYYHSPILLCGESQGPIPETEVRREYKHLTLHNDAQISNPRILTLIAVDIRTGKAQLYRNISCNRPVFYCCAPGLFVCSSHISLMRGDLPGLYINENLIPEYLIYSLIMPPRTIFKGVSCIPGGWSLTAEAIRGESRSVNLWRIEKTDEKQTATDVVYAALEHLKSALGSLRESGKPVNLLLSSGLDSAILGALSQQLRLPLASNSTGFHRITGSNCESHYAQCAADYLGLDHKIHDVEGEQYLSALVDAVEIAEEPISHLQTVLLASLFSSGIMPREAQILCGQNADQIFGTNMHLTYWKNRRLVRLTDHTAVKSLTKSLFVPWARRNYRARDLYYYNHSPDHKDCSHFLWGLETHGDIEWVKSHFGVDRARLIEGRMKFIDHYADWPVMDRISLLILHGDCDTTMHVWGKLAERYGYPMIYPFSWPGLINYSLNIDWKLKARKPRYLLEKIAKHLGLSEEIINRPEQSFSIDPKYWSPPGALLQPLVNMAGKMFGAASVHSLQSVDPGQAAILWNMIGLYLLDQLIVRRVSPQDIKGEISRRRLTKERVLV